MGFKPNCQLCQAPMIAKRKTSGNASGLALTLIVFIIGIVLCLTLIGAIVGVPLCILALFMGGKKSKVWQCSQCKAVVARG